MTATLDVGRIREQFPILARRVHGRPLAYLDNAATTQKPRAVIEAVRRFYEERNANVHRGAYTLSAEATDAYEGARARVARFVGAADAREIVFTRGTTEAINLVAWTLGLTRLREGDEILVTGMEHHSNIVPWQLVAARTGARLAVAPITDAGDLDREAFRKQLSSRTRIVALAHVSNALGTINPVRELAAEAHEKGALVLVDGAQAVPHLPVDVRDLGCDLYAFSGHKVYGPTGIGALWARRELLEEMPPWQGGGDMILEVRFEGSTWNEVPWKFEAGTPNVAGAVGLAAALDWVAETGLPAIAAHEADLLAYATARLGEIEGLRIVGTAPRKAAVVSFVLDEVHPHDVATFLDADGIAVRAGHHCAQPVMDRYGVPATVRASFAAYNTREEVDALVASLRKVREVFAR